MILRELFIVSVFFVFSLFNKDKKFQKEKIFSKDISIFVKAISAVLVLFGHCIQAVNNNFLVKIYVGWYAVAIFFFVSGYGLVVSTKKLDVSFIFIIKRFILVLIPFFVAHIFYFIIKNIFGTRLTLKDFLFGLLGQLNVVENSWYPIAIVIFYFIFWISYKFFNKYRLLVLSFLFVIVTIILYIVLGAEKEWWIISNLAFLVGVFLGEKDSTFSRRKMYFILSIVIFIIGYILVPVAALMFGKYYYLIYLVSINLKTSSIAMICILIAICFAKSNKFINFIGKISYEIYLYHGIFIWILSPFCNNFLILFVLTFTFTILISYIINILDSYLTNIFKKIK